MTDAELAILSLLSEGPTFDHELNRLIDQRGLRRWTAIGNSSMYYVLDKLERQGLVTKISEVDGRRQFAISQAGTGVLQTAIADLLSNTRAYDKSFELGLANMTVLRTGQVHSALLNRQQDLEIQLQRLRETLSKEETGSGSFKAAALFSHRIAMIEAELKWLAHFIGEWLQQAPTDPEIVLEPNIVPRSRQVVLPQDPDSVHKQATKKLEPHQRITPPGIQTEFKLKTPDTPDKKQPE